MLGVQHPGHVALTITSDLAKPCSFGKLVVGEGYLDLADLLLSPVIEVGHQ